MQIRIPLIRSERNILSYLEHVHTTTVEFLASVSAFLRFIEYPKYSQGPLFLLFAGFQIFFPWSEKMTTFLRLQLIFEKGERFLTNSKPSSFPHLAPEYVHFFHVLSPLMYL
jgi:hypothetical protein